jgi:hypothetical protein
VLDSNKVSIDTSPAGIELAVSSAKATAEEGVRQLNTSSVREVGSGYDVCVLTNANAKDGGVGVVIHLSRLGG